MPQLGRIGLKPGIGGAGAGAGPILPTSAFFNVTALNTAALKTIITAANANTARSRVVMVGDSTMWGAWANGVDATGLYSNSVPHYLAQQLNADVCPADDNCWTGCGALSTNAAFKAYNPFITGATSWVPNGSQAAAAVGGNMCRCVTNTAALGYLNGADYDTIEVLHSNPASTANFDIGTATTGVLVNISNNAGQANNATMLATVPVGSTIATAVQKTNKSTGAVNVNGVRIYVDAVKTLTIMGAGIPGSRSNDWVTDTGTYPFNALAGLAVLDPEWIFIELTINDARLGTTIPTYKANLQAIIDAQVLRGGGVCLVVGNQRYTGSDTNINGGTETSAALQQTYRDAMYDLATLNDLPLIDMWNAVGNWAALEALGYMATEGGFPSASHLLGTVANPGNQAKATVYHDFFEEVAAL